MKKLKFTDAACAHLQAYLSESEQAVAVRFSVRKSGCSGYKYVSTVITEVILGDILVNAEPACYVEPESLKALAGMIVDYKVGKFSSGLVYQNPNAQDICGCGESFKVDDD